MSSGRTETRRAPLIIRTPKDYWNGDRTLSQNFSFSIHVLQKEVERLKPLLEAADDLIPFVARENLR